MTALEVIAQILGIFGMICNILSYQGKNSKNIIGMQLAGTALFTGNYLLLGAYTGGAMNFIALLRNIWFFRKKPPKYCIHIFNAVYLAFYVLDFTVFGIEFTFVNALVNALPIASMVVQTISYFNGQPNIIRLAGYFCSPCWLIYNIINFTWGGIICECFALVSITVGLFRFRKSGKNETKN